MDSKLYLTLVCILSVVVVAAFADQPANELNRNNQAIDASSNDDKNLIDDQQQQQQLQPFKRPMNEPLFPTMDMSGELERPQFGFLANPIQSLFGSSPIFSSIFESIRRQREMMSNQFKNLELQAGQQNEVTSFTRNGITYVRTCTTKRVTPFDQNEPASSSPLPPSKEESDSTVSTAKP